MIDASKQRALEFILEWRRIKSMETDDCDRGLLLDALICQVAEADLGDIEFLLEIASLGVDAMGESESRYLPEVAEIVRWMDSCDETNLY